MSNLAGIFGISRQLGIQRVIFKGGAQEHKDSIGGTEDESPPRREKERHGELREDGADVGRMANVMIRAGRDDRMAALRLNADDLREKGVRSRRPYNEAIS
jgi:hypothetical protein